MLKITMSDQTGYTDFLKQPDIKKRFDLMYEEQKKIFMEKCLKDGFKKDFAETLSIKIALIVTDLYFTEIHKNSKSQKSKQIKKAEKNSPFLFL
ncbi:MAG: hypothetical protein N2510_07675 [Ignavibacteria bacterium]|nr:hypothetical protein [Ignavibacteria bacterium]